MKDAGCPAWYDIENINRTKYNGKELVNVDKICISDCADINNYENVITFIKKFFGDKKKHILSISNII